MARLLLPALVAYGWWIDPVSGGGGLPCLWLVVLGTRCSGCGLSRANALLWHGQVIDALHMNWLILPVASMVMVVFVQYFRAHGLTQERAWLNWVRLNWHR